MAAPSFSLDELLGCAVADTYATEERVTVVRGLGVRSWRWRRSDSTAAAVGTVVGIHRSERLTQQQGGPAFTHHYILPLILLADSGYDAVILYDQAGCGASDAAPGVEVAHPHLLTTVYYHAEELPAVIAAWGVQADHIVYGSSWGTIVAQLYGISQPSGLRALILDGALSDAKLYIETQWADNLSQLPLLTQSKLRSLEKEKAFASPEYKAIETALTAQFTHRLLPPAQAFLDSLAGANLSIYAAMQGPSEFAIGGVLETFNCTAELCKVQVPTLVMRGQFDTMTETCSMALVDNIPLAAPLVTIARAGHCKLIDEPQQCAEAMSRFLAGL